MGTGEGGLAEPLRAYQKHLIVQVASGRFGVDIDYLERGAAIEIKIGQGAKPGIGGHLPGEKVNSEISRTRMVPEGSDLISPAPHHDIYSIEDLGQLVRSLKEATEWKKPVFVKIAAVHNVAAIAAGIARSSADAVVVDGFRGGTGAGPAGLPRPRRDPGRGRGRRGRRELRAQGIRNEVSIIASGGIRESTDVVKIDRARCGRGLHRYGRAGRARVPGLRELLPQALPLGDRDPAAGPRGPARPRDRRRAGRQPDPRVDPGDHGPDGCGRDQLHREPARQPRPAPVVHDRPGADGRARREVRGGLIMETLVIDAAGMHYTPLNKRSGPRSPRGRRDRARERARPALHRERCPGGRGDRGPRRARRRSRDVHVGPAGRGLRQRRARPGNTMDCGEIVVHGSAGDAVGHSMRGGRIFVEGPIGYRGGIHMKQYLEKRPVLVVGEYARAFLGEYMAGGTVLVLGRHGGAAVAERGLGSGIHGGEIVLRGALDRGTSAWARRPCRSMKRPGNGFGPWSRRTGRTSASTSLPARRRLHADRAGLGPAVREQVLLGVR